MSFTFLQTTFDSGNIINESIPRGGIIDPAGVNQQGQWGQQLAYYITILWETAFIIAGLGFLGYLLIGGFRYLTAGGDQKMVTEARNVIIHAFVGLGIIAGSFVIIRIVESIFGITIVSGPLRFPTP